MKKIFTLLSILLGCVCLYAQVTYNATITPENCNSGDGQIVISASGGDGGPYTYSINGGSSFQSSGTFTSLSAGMYKVVVEDGASLQTTGFEVVNATGGATIDSITVDFPLSCSGDCNGQLTAHVSGGVAPYTFVWKDGSNNTLGSSSATISGLCADFYTVSVTQASGTINFWTEGFGTDNSCSNQNQLATSASNDNGSWSQSITAAEGGVPNQWFVSASEAFTGTGNCGDGCVGNPALDNQTLHVGSLGVGLCPGGDCGAAYNMGANGETHKRIESPVIDCSGKSSVTLSFDYMHFGELNNDAASLYYYDGTSWNVLAIPLPQTTCCGGPCGSLLVQGQWSPTRYSTVLPAAANDNPNVRIGFTWDNDANNSGADPSFAVDNIDLSVSSSNCTTASGIELTQPDEVAFTSSITGETCGQGNGSITITASSGTGVYTYSNDNGVTFQAGNTFSGLSPSSYDIVVEDGAGCQATGTVAVNEISDTTKPIPICINVTKYLDPGGSASIEVADLDGGSTDNCSLASVTASTTSFTCDDVGPNNITVTATDESGNDSTCVAVVTIADTIAPSALCKDTTLLLDVSGNANIAAQDLDMGSADNCSIATVVAFNTAFTCADLGVNNIVLTVTDDNGNQGTCLSVVTIVDTTAPSALCKDTTIMLDVTGNASIAALDLDMGSSDNCSVGVVVASKTAFTCADLGVNNIILTVTDDNGNQGTCLSVVTVTSADDPSFNFVQDTYCESGVDPAPTVTGDNGTFSGSNGVVINATTGEIDLSASGASNFAVTYTTGGGCPEDSVVNISITSAPTADFSYESSPFCPSGVAEITLGSEATAGDFSGDPTGLSLNVLSGEIDLDNSDAGVYVVTNFLAATNGCSEVSNSATITINTDYDVTDNLKGCDSVVLNGTTYYSSQLVIDTLIAVTGCDSVVTTDVAVNPSYEVSIDTALVTGDSLVWNNQSYFTDTTFSVNVLTVDGCDSIITVSASFVIIALEDIILGRVKLYPNPVNESLVVQSEQDITNIQILDMQGRERLFINNLMTREKVVNVDGLLEGVYLVRIQYLNGKHSIARFKKTN